VPVTYEIDKARGLIRTMCTGYVTFFEVAEHFQELERDPDCPKQLDVLLDLREITSLPSSEQLRAVSEQIGRLRDRVRFGAAAFVVGTDALFGTAMVLEVYAARGFRTTKIFRDAAEAESWLAQQQSEGA
jgi:hypothetical protein